MVREDPEALLRAMVAPLSMARRGEPLPGVPFSREAVAIAAHGELVSIELYGHPWVTGEYWPMIAPSFQVRATDDTGAEHRGMPGSGGGTPEGSRDFWFWPPVPPTARRIRMTASTLWEAAWADLDIPGRAG